MFEAAPFLHGLKDFQRAAVDHAFWRLFEAGDSTRRFLIADETGLGKTLIARGIIARTIEHLQHADDVDRIDIIYVCSNRDIADQNIRKLRLSDDSGTALSTRLSLLATHPDVLKPQRIRGSKPINFVAFTPGTSFKLGWQFGKADERILAFLLLRDHLSLDRSGLTALERILQGTISSRQRFQRRVKRCEAAWHQGFDPEITKAFLTAFDSCPISAELDALIEAVRGKHSLPQDLRAEAKAVTKQLRSMLARAGVEALEPDLIILDEFQRFRDLLTPTEGDDAAELATELFEQPVARTLLLSATPYKPFTLAEERAAGEDHFADFVATLRFLSDGDEGSVAALRDDLNELRRAAIGGLPVTEVRERLEDRLRRLMSRTERPTGDLGMLASCTTSADDVRVEDVVGYAALQRLADEVDAPLNVDYWKSAPYFVNFLDGYKLGSAVRERLRVPGGPEALRPALELSQRVDREQVRGFDRVEWGNARLRRLAEETIEQDWQELLWIPPSLPYHEGDEPFRSKREAGLTKRLIFSSWLAAPTAIASLMSYEAERRIWTAVGQRPNTPEERERVTARLSWRMDGGRPGAMSALVPFFPLPALARLTDPLEAARRDPSRLLAQDELVAGTVATLREQRPRKGDSTTSASAAWYWAAPLIDELRDGADIWGGSADDLAETFVGEVHGQDDPSSDDGRPSSALRAHLELALATLAGSAPDAPVPADLHEVVAFVGLAGPGNIAWRALDRVRRDGGSVTAIGHWRAATVLAAGLRNLFNRPEAILLVDRLFPSEHGYWHSMLRYCLAGDLQAVLDEHVHTTVDVEGLRADSDEDLMRLALQVRRSLSIRTATYRAFDPDRPGEQGSHDGIPFASRFALRFGSKRQTEDDERLPELRAAFNSPFWPFVLASTSIGQEGVDFHLWCHAVVHWNLPANPVDFEQREGRVNRYKGHAIRRNVASRHREDALRSDERDPWLALFAAAATEQHERLGDLHPYWVFPGETKIERHLLSLPLSRDQARWNELQQTLALYRLAYGQPRQEDLVALLHRDGDATAVDRNLRLSLEPRRGA